MEKKTPEELLREALVREGAAMAGISRSEPGKSARVSRALVEKYLEGARRSKNIDRILHTEEIVLRNELQRHANSQAMRTSLEASLAEHAVAMGMLETVRDPGAYRQVDAAHRLPRNRIGGVPRDEARQFFRSHAARLLNQDKSRLDDSEKRVLDKRRLNMRHAEKLYAALQERALGIGADRRQEQGMDPNS